MKPDPTRNTRAAKYRAETKASGGAQINVRIGPEAAAVLARMREKMTVREAVEVALLTQSTSENPSLPLAPSA